MAHFGTKHVGWHMLGNGQVSQAPTLRGVSDHVLTLQATCAPTMAVTSRLECHFMRPNRGMSPRHLICITSHDKC